MKTYKIPLAVLIALVALALINGGIITRQCTRWRTQTEAMDALARAGQWAQAEETWKTLSASWESWEKYLQIVTEHNEVETVDAIMKECRVLLHQQNSDTLSLSVAQLDGHFTHLGEMQALSVSNLL